MRHTRRRAACTTCVYPRYFCTKHAASSPALSTELNALLTDLHRPSESRLAHRGPPRGWIANYLMSSVDGLTLDSPQVSLVLRLNQGEVLPRGAPGGATGRAGWGGAGSQTGSRTPSLPPGRGRPRSALSPGPGSLHPRAVLVPALNAPGMCAPLPRSPGGRPGAEARLRGLASGKRGSDPASALYRGVGRAPPYVLIGKIGKLSSP